MTRLENFRRDPGPQAGLLASVNEGIEVTGGEIRDGWVEVTLEGWIWAASLRELEDPVYDHAVNVPAGENLRAEPDGQILARLINGFWLQELEVTGGWVRVTRTGWMWGRSLTGVGEDAPVVPAELAEAVDQPPIPEPQAQPPLTAPPDRANGSGAPDRAVTAGRASLRGTPDGDTTAILTSDAPVTILDRSGEWVRVRTEGWIHETDLRPVSGDVLVGVSGAEVRARPGDYEGRTLQWTLQFLALQTSDGLRRELPVGQRYMLARGPMPEAGFVYVLLTAEQVSEVERLSPLAQIIVLARVLVGRDQYLGNPVVELVQMSLRSP